MRVFYSNRTACGWQLSLSGSCRRTSAAIQMLSWEEGVRSAVLITGLLSQDRGQEKRVRRDLWRSPSPAPCSNQGQLQLVCDKNCHKLGGACSLPEHRCLPGRGDASSPWKLNESSAFLQLSTHACSIRADSTEILRGDWVKETNSEERKPESIRMDSFFFFPTKFLERSAVS